MVRKIKKRKSRDDGLVSITDKRLREDIKIALAFSSYLVRSSAKAKGYYKRELRRVVILYVASVVEALCLFLIKQSGLSKEKTEYKNARAITMPGLTVQDGKVLVAALQVKTSLSLVETPLSDAINILRRGNVVTLAFEKRLHKLREKRNSQHLYGRASKQMSKADVTRAFVILQGLFNIIRRRS
ncbi:MAG: hypothetical protein HYT27_03445 [Parcubacteria group bacterium]|nr:hypothetical protein [Parcubacteria group bacterium]